MWPLSIPRPEGQVLGYPAAVVGSQQQSCTAPLKLEDRKGQHLPPAVAGPQNTHFAWKWSKENTPHPNSSCYNRGRTWLEKAGWAVTAPHNKSHHPCSRLSCLCQGKGCLSPSVLPLLQPGRTCPIPAPAAPWDAHGEAQTTPGEASKNLTLETATTSPLDRQLGSTNPGVAVPCSSDHAITHSGHQHETQLQESLILLCSGMW